MQVGYRKKAQIYSTLQTSHLLLVILKKVTAMRLVGSSDLLPTLLDLSLALQIIERALVVFYSIQATVQRPSYSITKTPVLTVAQITEVLFCHFTAQ